MPEITNAVIPNPDNICPILADNGIPGPCELCTGGNECDSFEQDPHCRHCAGDMIRPEAS